MAAFMIALIKSTDMNDEVRNYLERIDDTLEPYGGRYRIHGGPYLPLEGQWEGDLVLFEFPDAERAEAWYRSAAYQAIQPLRAQNSVATVTLVAGVPDTHKGRDLLR